jgi:hypothetical protein
MSTDNNSSIAKTGQANVGDLMVCVYESFSCDLPKYIFSPLFYV